MMLLFLILCGVCLGHLGLGAKFNLIAAIVLIVLGALLVFTGFDASFSLRVD